MKPRDYDATIARIAGNIAAALVTTPAYQDRAGTIDAEGAIDTAVWMADLLCTTATRVR